MPSLRPMVLRAVPPARDEVLGHRGGEYCFIPGLRALREAVRTRHLTRAPAALAQPIWGQHESIVVIGGGPLASEAAFRHT